MRSLIEARNLRFRYEDGTRALNGVDFSLRAGETVAVLGANGSGKTTFVLHLNGLLQGEGYLEVCGVQVDRKTVSQIRPKVGLVFQDSESQLFMPTVLEDVTFGLLNRGLDTNHARARAMEALEQVGMKSAAAKAPYHLSAGEKKRAAIAGILAMEPEILVLDEPTTFLDPPGQRALAELLRRLPQGKILVTHDIPFALALCSRAVFFREGMIVAEGSVAEVAAQFEWRFAAEQTSACER
jgi:cobalt/nickel transport system ATP-binding protein